MMMVRITLGVLRLGILRSRLDWKYKLDGEGVGE